MLNWEILLQKNWNEKKANLDVYFKKSYKHRNDVDNIVEKQLFQDKANKNILPVNIFKNLKGANIIYYAKASKTLVNWWL